MSVLRFKTQSCKAEGCGDADTHREEALVKMEAEWGAGQGQPRDAKTASSHWELEEAWRLSLRISRRNQFCQHLDVGLLASIIIERYISV